MLDLNLTDGDWAELASCRAFAKFRKQLAEHVAALGLRLACGDAKGVVADETAQAYCEAVGEAKAYREIAGLTTVPQRDDD